MLTTPCNNVKLSPPPSHFPSEMNFFSLHSVPIKCRSHSVHHNAARAEQEMALSLAEDVETRGAFPPEFQAFCAALGEKHK